MGKALTFKPDQITHMLGVLAEHGGDAAAAADDLRDNHELEVRAQQLRDWRKDHWEQYRKLYEAAGTDMEERAIQKQRRLINLADEKLGPLIERAGEATGDQVPQALRAVADVKAKSGNALMQLTGRPVSPKDQGSSDIVELVMHMVDKGYLKLAPGVAEAVEGSAEEVGPDGDA